VTGSDPSARPPDCGSDAAPYVLGVLEPSEARAFVHHMQSCAVCRDEVAALVPALDVLPSCAPRYEVSPALRRRVMHAVRSEPKSGIARARRPPVRSRLRRLALTRPVLVAALAVVVALGVVIATRPSGSPTRVISASVGHAVLRVTDGRGELIVGHLPPAPTDRVYELWLQRGHGTPAPSTLFAVTSRGTAVLGVPGDLAGVTRVLVTVEPAGGSRVPTTRAVIVARA
jgi:anti-sigma-K factor RskA